MIHNLTDSPPLSQTDKLCLAALAGVLVVASVCYELTDGRAIQAVEAEADKPPAIAITAPSIDCTPLVEAIEARREALYWAEVPLDPVCQEALRESCEAHNVPVCLALGLIETESRFQPDAVSAGGCVGLFQLNAKYYPADLTPVENIRAGVAHLAGQIERYGGDIQAALRGYNKGYDDGDRAYAKRVLEASEKWGNG